MSVNEQFLDRLQLGNGSSEEGVLDVQGGSYFGNTVIIAGSTSVKNMFETAIVDPTVLSGNVVINILSGSVYYFPNSAASPWTFNVRGNANTPINGVMAVGQSLTFVCGCTQGPQAYFTNKLLVDGQYVYPKWQGGAAPVAGNAGSVDMYYFTLIKTASAQYTAFASITRFA